MAKNKKQQQVDTDEVQNGAKTATWEGDLDALNAALGDISALVTYRVSCYGGPKKGDEGVLVTRRIIFDTGAKDMLTEALRSIIIKDQRALSSRADLPGEPEEVYRDILNEAMPEGMPSDLNASDAGTSPFKDGKRGPADPVKTFAKANAAGKVTLEQKRELAKMLGIDPNTITE